MSEVKYLAQSFTSYTTEYNKHDTWLCYYDVLGATGFLAPTNLRLAVKIKALNPLDAEILRNTHF